MTLLRVRPMVAADGPAVEEIFRQGIATGNATFETDPPAWDAFDSGPHGVRPLGGAVARHDPRRASRGGLIPPQAVRRYVFIFR